MSGKKSDEREIVSFNEVESDITTMLELTDDQLVAVVGGYLDSKTCGDLTSCTINGDDCPHLKSCGWNLWEPNLPPES